MFVIAVWPAAPSAGENLNVELGMNEIGNLCLRRISTQDRRVKTDWQRIPTRELSRFEEHRPTIETWWDKLKFTDRKWPRQENLAREQGQGEKVQQSDRPPPSAQQHDRQHEPDRRWLDFISRFEQNKFRKANHKN
jgi:hypothetical protein